MGFSYREMHAFERTTAALIAEMNEKSGHNAFSLASAITDFLAQDDATILRDSNLVLSDIRALNERLTKLIG